MQATGRKQIGCWALGVVRIWVYTFSASSRSNCMCKLQVVGTCGDNVASTGAPSGSILSVTPAIH